MVDNSELKGSNNISSETEAVKYLQTEMADIFCKIAELLGNPGSLGSIYGLLYSSTVPLTMDQIVETLGISVGSASQGLRRLAELKTINSFKLEGERVTRYTAELEIRPYVSTFLYQQILPKLERSSDRIKALESDLSKLPPEMQIAMKERMTQAIKWHRLAKTLLPLVRGFLRD